MEDDLDRLMAVMASAFDPHWREAWTRRQVEDSLGLPSGFMLLGDERGEAPQDGAAAQGFVLARHVLDEVELLLIGVRPEMRGQGVGRRLMARFEAEARRRGSQRAFLEMRVANPAERLYRAAGYAPIGQRKGYYRTLRGEAVDALTFGKMLVR